MHYDSLPSILVRPSRGCTIEVHPQFSEASSLEELHVSPDYGFQGKPNHDE